MMYCSQHIENVEVIQPKISGNSGAGKSSGTEAALKLFPDEYLYTGSWSPMSLFDDGSGMNKDPAKRGMIIYSDDKVPSLEQQRLIKTAVSRSHDINRHKTTLPGGERTTVFIPQELVFIFTSVEDAMDQAFLNRYITINIDKNNELDKKYEKFLNSQYSSLENIKKKIEITFEIEVCKEIIRIIKQNRYIVIVPFSERINFISKGNRRAENQFYSVMCGHAVLNYMKRECFKDNGIIIVNATEEDFKFANLIFPKSIYQRDYKLQPFEIEVLQEIQKYKNKETAQNQSSLAKILNKDGGSISRILSGSEQKDFRGLYNTVPGVDFIENPVITTKDGYTHQKRGKFWYWNSERMEGISDMSDFATLLPETDDCDDVAPGQPCATQVQA